MSENKQSKEVGAQSWFLAFAEAETLNQIL